ncbi:MAG: fumarylacetoacetate hydrolase family protein [Cyclobacteriaceae bacterium]|nr:fumarylacetoacetate hydrolase family protein [Cyclobacteriaceae bacterium]
MKLIRFGEFEKEKPGVELPDGTRIDVSEAFNDFDEKFFADNGIEKLRNWLNANRNTAPKIDSSVRLGSPVARPSKIICIGLNYSDHAAEAGMKVPSEPIIFFKATTSLCGPNDPVVIPKNSKKTDWEVELALVIGKKAQYVEEDAALDYVAGYCLMNDYSEREFQLEREGQWVKGKSADTFSPLGPWLVTPGEAGDVHNLNLRLSVNGELLQSGNTKNLIFKIPMLVSYISQFMTLLPGDVISTGTPFGVGMAFKPPRYLKAGDVVSLGIDKLGISTQVAKSLF